MEFSIPENALSTLREFIRLPTEAMNKLARSIEAMSPTLRLRDRTAALASETQIDEQRVESMLQMFAGMIRAMSSAHVSLEQFVSELCDSLKKRSEVNFGPADWERFQSNIQTILGAKAFAISAKALDLLSENEHGLHSVRIITDVRHVFGTDPKARPEACVIVHMLNIVYHDIGRMRELYIALDSSDLDDLRQAIDRAEAKERNLESISNELGINCLSTKK